MATMFVNIEGAAVTRNNGKPKKVIRGKRRTALTKALRALTVLVNQEEEENRRAASNRYTPALIFGANAADVNRKAVIRLLARFNEMLQFKA